MTLNLWDAFNFKCLIINEKSIKCVIRYNFNVYAKKQKPIHNAILIRFNCNEFRSTMLLAGQPTARKCKLFIQRPNDDNKIKCIAFVENCDQIAIIIQMWSLH